MSIQAQAPTPAQLKPDNVWTQRQMKRSCEKEAGTQTQTQTQTQSVSFCAKTTQTDDSFAQLMLENAGLKEEVARLQTMLKDNSDLKRKISQLEKRLTKTDEIPFTLEDHQRFMKEQLDIFEKEKEKFQGQIKRLKEMNRKVIEYGRAELKEFKNSSMEYFRKEMVNILSEYPITPTEIQSILRTSNPNDMVGPLSSWSMNTILEQFNRMIEKGERLSPSGFFQFWTECILPRIDESSPQILHTLKDEWARFRSMCWSSNGDDTFAIQVNLVFSQYIQDYKNKKYDRYVVPFFNILIHSCKNLIILVGLVDVYYGEKETPTVVDTVYEEFVCLMTLPDPLTVLKEIVELSKKKLAEAAENPYPMPTVFNKLVYGIELQGPSFFETIAKSL
jgi:cell division protein FtsB